jgi:translation initiation factor 2D
MFLRPFRVKSRSALKVAERKLLRQRLNEKFLGLDTLLPTKGLLEILRLLTSSGIQVSVILLEKQPLFFEFDDQLIPTVYTLCQTHDLLKCVYTWRSVFDKMLGGADLMLPGVHKSESEEVVLKTLKRDEICAVGLVGERNAMGIVKCLMSWEDMQKSHMRGKGFKVLHLCGDKLWELGSLTNPQITDSLARLVSSTLSVTCSASANDVRGVVRRELLNNLDKKSPSSSCFEHGYTTEDIEHHEETYYDKHMVAGVQFEEPISNDDLLCNEGMDKLLKECFFRALNLVAETAKLPLLTSTFYSAFMLPQCPTGMRLDVKKSSYKKLSQFLRMMHELGVIRVQETMKGVESITNIDFDHPSINNISSPASSSASAAGTTKLVQDIYVSELYSPSHKLLPVFHCYGYDKSSLLSATQCCCIGSNTM